MFQVAGSTGTEQVPTNWYTSIRALPFSCRISWNVKPKKWENARTLRSGYERLRGPKKGGLANCFLLAKILSVTHMGMCKHQRHVQMYGSSWWKHMDRYGECKKAASGIPWDSAAILRNQKRTTRMTSIHLKRYGYRSKPRDPGDQKRWSLLCISSSHAMWCGMDFDSSPLVICTSLGLRVQT